MRFVTARPAARLRRAKLAAVKRFIAASLVAVVATGCLSSTHVIPHGDLQALAQEPPEERARHVRVVQGFVGSDEPPRAPAVGVETVVVVAPGPSVPVGRFGPSTAKAKTDNAKVWIVIAAFTAVGLAVTEGMRYDGWVAMHPMQPVHLFGADGSYTWVPLAQLDPQTAAWSAKAFVRREEGPPWLELGRAPLDRRGGTYSLLLGTGGLVDADGSLQNGFLAHIELGFAPIQELVILLDVGLGFAEAPDSTLYESRTAAELQLYPFANLHTIHPGVYGEIGLGYRSQDNPDIDTSSLYYAGGGILQLELTTRLALTVRGGVASMYHTVGGEIVGGLSIY